MLSMYVIDPLRRANTYYAITNRRAIIISRRGNRLLRSLEFASIRSFEMTQDFTGAGTIDCFVPGDPDFSLVEGQGPRVPGPLFEYISDPSTVLALLRRQLPKRISS
jgi:hypothetical protein